jgi:hypothetical protein
VVLRGAAATRRVPMTRFYTGYRQTVARSRRADRGLRDSRGEGTAVVPQGRTRAAQAIAKIVVAGVRDSQHPVWR